MNLIKIAEKWKNNLYKDDKELKEDLDKVKIFTPITSATVDGGWQSLFQIFNARS